jgi:hypothetical protein
VKDQNTCIETLQKSSLEAQEVIKSQIMENQTLKDQLRIAKKINSEEGTHRKATELIKPA